MSEHQIGIIGYGGFGQFLHQSWNMLDGVEVVAVADYDAKRDPGEPLQFYCKWEELVADPEIEIVVIATPPFTHADMACEAMRKGKHVLIEKPMAISVEDAQRIIKLRDETDQVAGIDYMQRYNPLVEALATLTRNGALGNLRRAFVENYAQDETLHPDHWFWNRDLSGGILVEHGVHFFDLINSLTPANPISVSGTTHSRNEIQEDQVLATVLYNDGLIATHYHDFSRPGFFEQTSLRLVYDLAQVDLQGWIPLTGQITALINEETAKLMQQLPDFKQTGRSVIKDIPDHSRPKGWGQNSSLSDSSRERSIVSGGKSYPVNTLITGTFAAKGIKAEVYQSCVQRLMIDLIHKIEVPKFSLRVGLEDGLASLQLAVQAAASALAAGKKRIISEC